MTKLDRRLADAAGHDRIGLVQLGHVESSLIERVVFVLRDVQDLKPRQRLAVLQAAIQVVQGSGSEGKK